MGSGHSRQKENPNRDDVIDMLRTLGQAYREDQKIAVLQQIMREINSSPSQKELLKKVSFRDRIATVNIFEQIFRTATATYNVSMKQVVIALTLALATGDDVQKDDQDALVAAGIAQTVLDVYAFAKAYKAPRKLIEDTTFLVDALIPYETFCDQFIGSGGSKILFSQLIAPDAEGVTRQKAIKTLRQLSNSPKYLKLMSESGGVSALIKALSLDQSAEFARDALKIITTLCRNNAKLLGQLLEISEHIVNILNLLTMDDMGIVSDTMFIIYSMALREKNLLVIHENNGFFRIYAVLMSKFPQTDPRLLYHTVGSLSALLQQAENCEHFLQQGGLQLMWNYLERVRLLKSEPPKKPRFNSAASDTSNSSQNASLLDVRVSTGEDDGSERKDSGKVKLRDGELVFDRGRIVGIRFSNVQLPVPARITSAWLRLTAQNTHFRSCEFTLYGEATANPAAFTKEAYSISNRVKTESYVTWRASSWETKQVYTTGDMKAIVNEIIQNTDWQTGNSMVFLITATGERAAFSHDGDWDLAPVLHIEYVPRDPTSVQKEGDELKAGGSRPASRIGTPPLDGSPRDSSLSREFNNNIIRASLSLLDRLAEDAARRERIATSFAFQYVLSLIADVNNSDMGIVTQDRYLMNYYGSTQPPARLSTPVRSARGQPVSARSNASGGGIPAHSSQVGGNHPASSSAMVPPTAGLIFEIILAAIALLGKLNTDCPPNQKSFPRQDNVSKLIGFLRFSADNRTMRLVIAVMRALDSFLPNNPTVPPTPAMTTMKRSASRVSVSSGPLSPPGSSVVVSGLTLAPPAPTSPTGANPEDGMASAAAGPMINIDPFALNPIELAPSPLPSVLTAVVVAALCEILQSLDVESLLKPNAKPTGGGGGGGGGAASTSVQANAASLALKLLLKLVAFEDVPDLLLEHLPAESLKKFQQNMVASSASIGRNLRATNIVQMGQQATILIAALTRTPESRRMLCTMGLLPSMESGVDHLGRRLVLKRRMLPDGSIEEYYEAEEEPESPTAAAERERQREMTARNPHLRRIASLSNLEGRRKRALVRYVTEETESLNAIAQKLLGDEDRFREIFDEHGKPMDLDPTEYICVGSLLMVPDDDDPALSDEEIYRLKRRFSDPQFWARTKDRLLDDKHVDFPPSPRFGTPTKGAEDSRPTSTGTQSSTDSHASDVDQVNVREARARRRIQDHETMEFQDIMKELADEIMREEKRILQEREQAQMRFRAAMSQLNRDYLLLLQDIQDAQSNAWSKIVSADNTGRQYIKKLFDERLAFTSDALREHVVRSSDEGFGRGLIEREFVCAHEAIARVDIVSTEKDNWLIIQKMWLTVQTERKARLNEYGLEAKIFRDMLDRFAYLAEIIKQNLAARIGLNKAEAAARDRFEAEVARHLNQAMLLRMLLDLETSHIASLEKLSQEQQSVFCDRVLEFQNQQRELMAQLEETARAALDLETEGQLNQLWADLALLQCLQEHSTTRVRLESETIEYLSNVFATFAEETIAMAVEEEEKTRAAVQEEWLRLMVVYSGAWNRLGIEAREELPRAAIEKQAVHDLNALHLRCVDLVIKTMFVSEEHNRYRLESDWAVWSRSMVHQFNRMELMRVEGDQRAYLTQRLNDEMRLLRKEGRAERALLRCIDLPRAEVPVRKALENLEDSTFWQLRFDCLIGEAMISRRAVERVERREYSRVGRGLSDYLHMCDLDKTAMMFDIWHPQDTLLVPFVVPCGRTNPNDRPLKTSGISPSTGSSSRAAAYRLLANRTVGSASIGAITPTQATASPAAITVASPSPVKPTSTGTPARFPPLSQPGFSPAKSASPAVSSHKRQNSPPRRIQPKSRPSHSPKRTPAVGTSTVLPTPQLRDTNRRNIKQPNSPKLSPPRQLHGPGELEAMEASVEQEVRKLLHLPSKSVNQFLPQRVISTAVVSPRPQQQRPASGSHLPQV